MVIRRAKHEGLTQHVAVDVSTAVLLTGRKYVKLFDQLHSRVEGWLRSPTLVSTACSQSPL